MCTYVDATLGLGIGFGAAGAGFAGAGFAEALKGGVGGGPLNGGIGCFVFGAATHFAVGACILKDALLYNCRKGITGCGALDALLQGVVLLLLLLLPAGMPL